MSAGDAVDHLAGITPGSPLAATRGERPDVARHTAGAEAALMRPADPGRISRAERAALACEVALQHGDDALARHYAALADIADATVGGSRWSALVEHARRVARRPAEATRADVERLRQAGLSERDIVTLTQIVAFVSYQARIVAGLRLMGGGSGG